MMQKIIIFFFICSLCSCIKEQKNKEVTLEEKTVSKEVSIEEEPTLEIIVSNIENPIKKTTLISSFASTIKKVLSNKLSLLMPDDFALMNRSLLEMKYPVKSRRPTEVYTNTNIQNTTL